MGYESVQLKKELLVDQIYTVHYFKYQNGLRLDGESGDFWKFQCIDKGEADINTDTGRHLLSHGQIIFHKPNEYHSLRTVGNNPLNIISVSFSCASPYMDFFENRILELSDTERALLGFILKEARHCFSSPLDNPYTKKMELRSNILFGSQQLLILYLEEFLIHIIRRYHSSHPLTSGRSVPSREPSDVCRKIIFYLQEHVREYVSVESICHDNLIGRSQLQKLFRERYGCGVIEFFSRMKIDLAKKLIQKNEMNFTQISEFLGYSSIHYFSRQFKKLAGMTPTEYATSIRMKQTQKNGL